jgi:epoxyqueuosine reductase QueG
LKAALAQEARALGFDCVGVTDPQSIVQAGKYFREFLEAGAHGDMDWLATSPERRTNPRVLWTHVRSVIMLGVNYGPDENPLAILAQRTRGAISVYAQAFELSPRAEYKQVVATKELPDFQCLAIPDTITLPTAQPSRGTANDLSLNPRVQENRSPGNQP